MTTIAAVIPSYNAGPFLRRAIGSVLEQTVPVAEIIVVDDGSTDGTAAIAAEYTLVTLVRQENKGLSAARNAGLRVAKSDYVAFLDADDWWEPAHIENALDAIARGAKWTASAWVRTDGATSKTVLPFGSSGLREYLHVAAYRNVIIPSGVVVERNLILDIGGFPEDIRRHAEDKITWAKLAAKCPYVFFIARPTANYFQHPGSITKVQLSHVERIQTGINRATTLLDILDANPSKAARRMARGTALRSAQSLMRGRGEIPLEPFHRILKPLRHFEKAVILFASPFNSTRAVVSRSIKLALLFLK